MRYLCLGNNTEDTDIQTQKLSGVQPFLGLLSECTGTVLTQDAYSAPGWYHSSVFDVDLGRLRVVCNTVDQVIVLDQPKSSYNHPDAFLKTVKLGLEVGAQFQNPLAVKTVQYWQNLVTESSSFCIYPFIELITHFDHTTVCCRSVEPVTKTTELVDFGTDQNYQTLRQCMLQGQRLDTHCRVCYQDEARGIVSARQQETVEWANRLDLGHVSDLDSVRHPVYYEVRASNQCNLNCRMCTPYDSNRIEKLHRKIGWLDKAQILPVKNTQGFDLVNLDHVKKLYVSGGEPTLMHEFYEFLSQCIDLGRTDFEIQINTNGTRLSRRFRELIRSFSNVSFIISIDGYDSVNDYIRHPSIFQDIVDNWRWLLLQGYGVTVNTTVSIYNINCLDQLFAYIDQEFPDTMIHCQSVDSDGCLSLFNYPRADEIIKVLKAIQCMPCYQRSSNLANFIDSVLANYCDRTGHDQSLLQDFFVYDHALNLALTPRRSTNLAEVNPELAKFDCGSNSLQKVTKKRRV